MGRILRRRPTPSSSTRSKKRDVVRVMELVGKEIDRGLGVLVFPEGTSGKGDELLPRPSLLEFACTRDLPVHWATISYQTPAGRAAGQPLGLLVGLEGFFPLPADDQAAVLRRPACTSARSRWPAATCKALAEGLRLRMLEEFEAMA